VKKKEKGCKKKFFLEKQQAEAPKPSPRLEQKKDCCHDRNKHVPIATS
jgi:hypothetical protein